jgi:threonine dehydratase
MGIVFAAMSPKVRLVGVQPEVSAPMARWFELGRPADLKLGRSFAEGIGAWIEESTMTWPIVKAKVHGFELVSEDDLKDAMVFALLEHRLVIEGSAAASIAGLRKLGARGELGEASRAVAVLSGGNIDLGRYFDLLGPRLDRAVGRA